MFRSCLKAEMSQKKNSESDTQNCKEARIERNKGSTNNISMLNPKSIEIQ